MNWYKKAKSECKGWIAVRLPIMASKRVQKWGYDNIPDSVLSKEEGSGRELDTHITVIYGVCNNSREKVEKILENYKNIKVKMGKVGFFRKNPDFDVVKIEIISKDLKRLHEEIKRTLHVEETHDRYQPHCTIAYVQKGEAAQFVGDNFIEGEIFEFNKVVFVNNNDEEFEIKTE